MSSNPDLSTPDAVEDAGLSDQKQSSKSDLKEHVMLRSLPVGAVILIVIVLLILIGTGLVADWLGVWWEMLSIPLVLWLGAVSHANWGRWSSESWL